MHLVNDLNIIQADEATESAQPFGGKAPVGELIASVDVTGLAHLDRGRVRGQTRTVGS